MLKEENNQGISSTSEDAVVNQIKMDGTETTIEPNETIEIISVDETQIEELEQSEQLNETTSEVDSNDISDNSQAIDGVSTYDEASVSDPILEHSHSDDEFEDEESKIIDESETIHIDYSGFTKQQLLGLAIDAPKNLVSREAIKKIQNIRPFFDSLLKAEYQDQLHTFLEEGHEAELFVFVDDGSKQKFYEAFKLAQEDRAEERKRIENEKLKNLEKKQAIINRIKDLTESDETVDSLNEIKILQNEWKTIRVIPKPNVQELYDRYHFYLDKFYDNLAINRELKELDRQKNLGIKIDLCNKVDAIKNETSLKKAFIMLAKYQEEFKNTGPVPKEFSEEIWTRFKAIIDDIYKQRKDQFDEIQSKREENLKLKEVLVEKARLISNYIPQKGSEWKTNFDELNKLMSEWKVIGQVPKTQNEAIWHNFRDQFAIFSKNRNEQYKKINSERKTNISLREDICKRADELKDHEDLNFATKEFIKLQEEWKTSGFIPESVAKTLWKRFRKSCDDFFSRKQTLFEGRKLEEGENLTKKQDILTQMEVLLVEENAENALNALKDIQLRWNEIGYVPLKNKKTISDTYHEQLDKLYKKFRKNKDGYKKAHLNEHYTQIANQPGGDKKLGDDERRLKEKIKGLKTEIETWENNIEFFAKSKNAEKFRKDIEDKIAKVNGQIESMTKELVVLRSAKVEQV